MPRYKRSEYRAEKRAPEKPFAQQTKRCEGALGTCEVRSLHLCSRCSRPFCAEHLNYHLTKCRGMR